MAAEEVAYLWRRMILLEEWTERDDDGLVSLFGKGVLLQDFRNELKWMLVDFVVVDGRCHGHVNQVLGKKKRHL